MRTRKRDRLPSVRRFLRNRSERRFFAVSFVRDEVAGEDFDDALGGAYDRNYVETHVRRAGYQTFLFDLVTGKAERKDRPDDRNRLDESLREAPPACSNDS